MPQPRETGSSRPDWRTNAAILAGMAVPVAALACLAWLSAPVDARPSPGAGTTSSAASPAGPARQLKVEVVASYPHDPAAFTQGLHYEGNGVLYESTGLEGQSTLRRVDLSTGRVVQAFALAPDLFGEGLARLPGLLLQLTWRNEVALAYDPASLKVVASIPYTGEGWGLCFDGTSLVMSDGSDTLTFRGRMDFAVQRSVRVVHDGVPLPELNELECVDGSVYANVWNKSFIVRIDPASGIVTERIDAGGLLSEREAAGVDVLNGIAYDPADGTFFITGKRWPKLFRVRFVAAGP